MVIFVLEIESFSTSYKSPPSLGHPQMSPNLTYTDGVPVLSSPSMPCLNCPFVVSPRHFELLWCGLGFSGWVLIQGSRRTGLLVALPRTVTLVH